MRWTLFCGGWKGKEVTVHVQDDCDVCVLELQIGVTNNEGEFCSSGRCCCESREGERGRDGGELPFAVQLRAGGL